MGSTEGKMENFRITQIPQCQYYFGKSLMWVNYYEYTLTGWPSIIYTIDSWQVLTDNHNCDDNHTSLLLWYFSASSFAWRRLLVVSSRIICIFSNSNCLTFISFCRSDCLLSAESCNCRNLQQSKNQHINNASFYSGLSSHQSHVAKAQFKRQSFHVPNSVIARGRF